jgi:hypothetical protein
MRRAFWFRSLASLLAVWLPLISGEPGLLHPCPMHGAGRAVIASLRGESTVAAPASHAHHADHSQAPAHQHHDCSCINCCSAATATFLASSAPTTEIAVAEYAVSRTVPSVETLARPAPEYSLPYTTGPPRA